MEIQHSKFLEIKESVVFQITVNTQWKPWYSSWPVIFWVHKYILSANYEKFKRDYSGKHELYIA